MRLFERNICVIENFALSFYIIELYWFSWESLLDFLIMIHGPSSLFIWRLVDVSWFSSFIKNASFREEHFCHWDFRSIFPHYRVILILVRNPLGLFDYDPWSFELIYLTIRWCELIFKYRSKMRLFERNIFVIENFALSFLIIELY